MSNSVFTINQADMQFDYAINTPQQRAEIAYQPNQGDRVPPVATEPSSSLASGSVIVEMTNLHNNPPFGVGEVDLINYGALLWLNNNVFPTPERAQQIINQNPGIVVAHSRGTLPFLAKIACAPYLPVTVRPLTGGCKAHALSKEDYMAGGGRPAI